MPTINVRGQANNPLVMQAGRVRLNDLLVDNYVPMATSLGWEIFSDANWIGVVMTQSSTNASTCFITEKATTAFRVFCTLGVPEVEIVAHGRL